MTYNLYPVCTAVQHSDMGPDQFPDMGSDQSRVLQPLIVSQLTIIKTALKNPIPYLSSELFNEFKVLYLRQLFF